MWKSLTRLRRLAGSLFLGLPLLGCLAPRVPSVPIPVKLVPAPAPAKDRYLVVVLPGRGDDFEDLTRTGMAEAVQKSWPEADVLLAGAVLGYYSDGRIAERLHDQVIGPARSRGYREIWLSGPSMGGMGALLYELRYPHDVTGLVLYAPFLGPPSLVRSVAEAGGPAGWDPGPTPQAVDKDNYPHELWRLVKSWRDPEEARRIWLACGNQDRFIDAARLIAPLLPPEQFVELPGGHEWAVWNAAAARIFSGIASEPR